jgi:TolB protein
MPDSRRVLTNAIEGSSAGVYVMNLDGTGLRLLRRGDSRTRYGVPHLSPDGTHVAYFTRTGPAETPASIHVMNADGSADRVIVEQVSLDEASWSGLPWSPDSTRLLYVARQESSDAASIFVIAADGSGSPVALSPPSPDTENPKAATWSPDGEQIAANVL